jgi:ABC-2 type transport system ATP-binding protein
MNTNNHFAVEVHDLEKKFGDFTAVDHINFQVKRGEIFGFLGPNGAGKSTTIRMLCGIILPTSGSGQVGGYDIIRQQDKIKQNIGYMSQKFSLYDDLTVEENIDFYAGIYSIGSKVKKERKEWIIRMAGIEGLKNSLTSSLSRGWKQRLALGCAIIHEPGIIFLDEPTSGVDPIARRNFWNLIKEMAGNGVTVFVTTHYMDEAENCDRIALIYQGSIVAMGKPDDLKNECMHEDVLEISVANPEEWIGRLEKLEIVKEVALFGTNLHAVVRGAAEASEEIRGMFSEAKISGYTVNKIRPSLEDVFVSMVESYGKKEGICESHPG